MIKNYIPIPNFVMLSIQITASFPPYCLLSLNIVKKTRQTKTWVSLGFKSRGKKKMEKEYLGRDGQGSLGAYILLLIPKYG